MLTICIPTKDRLSWVKRLLSCYDSVDHDFIIYIGDSSDANTHKELKNFTNKQDIPQYSASEANLEQENIAPVGRRE